MRDDEGIGQSLRAAQLLALALGFGAAHIGADTHHMGLATGLDKRREPGTAQALAELARIGLLGEGSHLYRPGTGPAAGGILRRRRRGTLKLDHFRPRIGHRGDQLLPRLLGLGTMA